MEKEKTLPAFIGKMNIQKAIEQVKNRLACDQGKAETILGVVVQINSTGMDGWELIKYLEAMKR